MGTSPKDKEIVKFLRENGEDKKQITDGKHQANDDMQSEGWLPERAVTKYLEKWGTAEQLEEWNNQNR